MRISIKRLAFLSLFVLISSCEQTSHSSINVTPSTWRYPNPGTVYAYQDSSMDTGVGQFSPVLSENTVVFLGIDSVDGKPNVGRFRDSHAQRTFYLYMNPSGDILRGDSSGGSTFDRIIHFYWTTYPVNRHVSNTIILQNAID